MNPSPTSSPSRDPTERFSDRVDDYVRYRPGYPPALIDYLHERGALPHGGRIADIGSGTGISSALFLDAGATVFAIEPNAAMRAAAERWLGDRRGFRSVDGRAEATTLDNASVDLVAAGTAFHWFFDREATRAEFARILRSPRFVALFWNVRRLDTDFLRDYEALLQAHCPEYSAVWSRERANEASMRAFFGEGYVDGPAFDNLQSLDFDALRGRLLSSSYAPREGQPGYAPMIDALRALVDAHADNGRVAMHYDTRLYLGRLDR